MDEEVKQLIGHLELNGDFEAIDTIRRLHERNIRLKASNHAYMLALSNGPVIHVHNAPLPVVPDKVEEKDVLGVIQPVKYTPSADTSVPRVWTRIELTDWAKAKLQGIEGYVPADEHKGYARAMQHLLMHANGMETEV